MSEEIRSNSLDSESEKITKNVSTTDVCYSAIFVVNNRQHIDLFLPIQRYMRDFKIFYVNLICWGTQRLEIEDYLTSLNLPYRTVNKLFVQEQIVPLLQCINPNIIIVGHDTLPENRKVIQSAINLNIPTLLIQDGIYTDCMINRLANKSNLVGKSVKAQRILLDSRYGLLEKVEIVIYGIESMIFSRKCVGRGEYSNIAVFGNATKRLLEREGVDSRKIIMTGSPKFDYLYLRNSNKNHLTLQQLDMLSSEKIILLITQPFVELGIWTQKQREDYISEICMAIEKIEGCQLIIKFHQGREKGCDYNNISQSYGINPIICGEIDLYKLIEISDAAITVSSTGGLETIAAEKPLIIFDPFDTPGSSFYNSENILFLSSIDDLSLTVSKVISDCLFREKLIHMQHLFVEENIFKNDGKAAERIYSQIVDMIRD